MIRFRWFAFDNPVAGFGIAFALTGPIVVIAGGGSAPTPHKVWVAHRASDSSLRSTSEGVYTTDQAARGDALYRTACASCHGSDMSVGDTGPALAGAKFFGNWRGQTLGDLADRIAATMPPDDPNTVDQEKVTDLIAAILSANKVPPGSAALVSDPAALRRIRIDPPIR